MIPLLSNTNSPILSILYRNFPLGQEARQMMETMEMLWSHLPLNGLGHALVVLAMLERRYRKDLVLLAWMDSHLETLEAQQITYRLAPVGLLPLL